MNFRVLISYLFLLSFLGFLVFAYINYSNKTANLDQKALEETVAKIINDHPELIVESIQKWQQENTKKALEESKKSAKDLFDEIVANEKINRLGPDDAPIKIVEFFDFSCGFCKKMLPVKKAILDTGKVQFIILNLPIFGPASVDLAKADIAIAMLDKEKYQKMHFDLINNHIVGKEGILKFIKDNNLDIRNFEQNFSSKTVEEALARNKKAAEQLNVPGTPSYIINGDYYGGAVLEEAIIPYLEKEGVKFQHKPSNP